MLAALTAMLAPPPSAAGAAPFGYLPTPTDQISIPGAASGTEITPSGSLYTGSAELGFRFGPRLAPWNGRTRTLLDGWLPVLSSGASSGGARYRLQVFTAAAAGRPVDFAGVTITNPSRRPLTARWRAAARWSGGARLSTGAYAFRFPRPVANDSYHGYVQPGEAFDPGAVWGFSGRAATRSGRVIYLFPPGARLSARPTAGPLAAGSPAGAAAYALRLAPHATRRLVFRLPVDPPPAGAPEVSRIARADPGRALAATIGIWRGALSGAMRIALPEAKASDTYRTSLVNMLEARTPRAGGVAQSVNLLNYHSFYLRDSAMIDEAYLLAGLAGVVRENLGYVAKFQQPDGLYMSQPEQYDGFGEALWSYAEYARREGGAAYARTVLPAVFRAMGWLASERRSDPLGLMPFSHTYDNEQTPGHLAGDDFWAYAGAAGAVELARLAGRPDLAARWADDAASLRRAIRRAVRAAAGRTHGAIPPALDLPGGYTWGNLWAAWPTGTLGPADPAVVATIRAARRRFREGIATYGRLLHGYLGFRVLETDLLGGRQALVVRGLDDELAHTTATDGGFEFALRYGAPGARDDLTPHGWWAAEYVLLLRNMLVREDRGDVRLASALSPAWVRPGRTLSVRGAPTLSGPVSFTLRGTPAGAALAWRSRLRPGAKLVFTVPAFVGRVRARGFDRRHGVIRLRGARGRLAIRWSRRASAESFAAAVRRLPRG